MKKPQHTSSHTTDFGYQQIPAEDKARRVDQVFQSVAPKYDLMNDLMSLGIHRLWKRFAIALSGVSSGQLVLDLAGGTGDLAARFVPLVGSRGMVVLADINAAMLRRGRSRMVDRGRVENIGYLQVNAESLSLKESMFDCVTIAFGLRNVTHKERALQSMLRVLKPGGRLLILEFSKPVVPFLGMIYDTYSFRVLPRLGKLIVGDEHSYQYLVESIRMHPDQKTLVEMMQDAGFEYCEYFNLSGGIVALHRGYKI